MANKVYIKIYNLEMILPKCMTILMIVKLTSVFGYFLNQAIAAQRSENSLQASLAEDQGMGCKIPVTDPFAPEIMRFNRIFPPIQCDVPPNWVRCFQSTCQLEEALVSTIVNDVEDITCVYRDLIYKNDKEYFLSINETEVKGTEIYNLNQSDHVYVKCYAYQKDMSREWHGFLAGLRPLYEIASDTNAYNVLILAFDSASKNGFIRKMPKSYEYLEKEFQATIFNGYNIVGDGTTAAVLAMLTGQTELELPECRKSAKNSQYTDVLPLIFYYLKGHGYRTAYFEDSPFFGTFQYRLNGFRSQPADHYLRAFLMEEKTVYGDKFCVGDTPLYQLMIDLTDQFFQRPGKKFAFTFIADISHSDFNRISTADEPLVTFLKELTKRGTLWNTLVMIMGDHGPRFANVRKTLQGKLEERLPFLAIRLPDDLVLARPDAQKALEKNSHVLTTPFDIHATILDVLNMEHYQSQYKVKGAELPRSLSLIKPIPHNRSCSEAGIESHWCSCLKTEHVHNGDHIRSLLAVELVNYLNNMTQFLRAKCAIRYVTHIIWVTKTAPNRRVLEFIASRDEDGYEGRFGVPTRTNVHRQDYQIKVEVGPGTALYEATITHVKRNEFIVNAISRTNEYKNEPGCLHGQFPHLYPYCYCTNKERIYFHK